MKLNKRDRKNLEVLAEYLDTILRFEFAVTTKIERKCVEEACAYISLNQNKLTKAIDKPKSNIV